jgi:hypothetical protein
MVAVKEIRVHDSGADDDACRRNGHSVTQRSTWKETEIGWRPACWPNRSVLKERGCVTTSDDVPSVVDAVGETSGSTTEAWELGH